jgi:hypothetical protein
MTIQSPVGQQSHPPLALPDGAYQVAAGGDIKCTGGYCGSGGTYGTSAMYTVSGLPVCRDCAVKLLGLDGLSGAEQQEYLNKVAPAKPTGR